MRSVMKNLFHSILAAIIVLPLLFTHSDAQPQEGDYMHVDYLQIDRGEIRSFTAQIETVLKYVQQTRVNTGSLKEWYVYRVLYPGSQDTAHNFVSVSICSNICAFEDYRDSLIDDLDKPEFAELIKTYQDLMIPNHSELWRIHNNFTRTDDMEPARYFSMDYMNVRDGMEYAYRMMEDEIARPLHERRMENDTMEAWQLFSLVIPGGSKYGYNFATGNHFKNLRDFEFGFTDELIRQTHPDTNISEFFENIERTRDPVRIEVWELVDYVK